MASSIGKNTLLTVHFGIVNYLYALSVSFGAMMMIPNYLVWAPESLMWRLSHNGVTISDQKCILCSDEKLPN